MLKLIKTKKLNTQASNRVNQFPVNPLLVSETLVLQKYIAQQNFAINVHKTDCMREQCVEKF